MVRSDFLYFSLSLSLSPDLVEVFKKMTEFGDGMMKVDSKGNAMERISAMNDSYDVL